MRNRLTRRIIVSRSFPSSINFALERFRFPALRNTLTRGSRIRGLFPYFRPRTGWNDSSNPRRFPLKGSHQIKCKSSRCPLSFCSFAPKFARGGSGGPLFALGSDRGRAGVQVCLTSCEIARQGFKTAEMPARVSRNTMRQSETGAQTVQLVSFSSLLLTFYLPPLLRSFPLLLRPLSSTCKLSDPGHWLFLPFRNSQKAGSKVAYKPGSAALDHILTGICCGK